MRLRFVIAPMLAMSQSQATQCVAIANGAPLPVHIVERVTHTKKVIALDGAVKTLRERYPLIKPDILIGDFDSCELADREYFEGATVIHAPSQDINDLEKGILQCDALGAEIWILNALGLDRLDHTLATMHILKKYHKPGRRLRLVSEKQILEFVKESEISFKAKLGEAVGVFGFSSARVTSRGLQYEMIDYLVEGTQFSSSNYVASPQVFIHIQGEALVTYPHAF